MQDELNAIGEKALGQLAQATTLEALEQARLDTLGKKGALAQVLSGLGRASPDQRPIIGALANQWKAKIETALTARREELEGAALAAKLARERIDITLPAIRRHLGALSPITSTERLIVRALKRLGFETLSGPEIETEYLNFEAVNIPAEHPARDMQDTFFVGPGVVLRTHTSPVQMRALRDRRTMPIRIACGGAVYRCDDDATHSPMFHQVEGLWVDEVGPKGARVRMSDLKGTLEFFAKELFGSSTRIRLRPSYFPFVEPGAEIDVSCFRCRARTDAQCRVCRGSGWLEILGAGMVHPRLFEAAEMDPARFTGFAFGAGVERIAMLLHEIPDLRLMFRGDQRFGLQFVAP